MLNSLRLPRAINREFHRLVREEEERLRMDCVRVWRVIRYIMQIWEYSTAMSMPSDVMQKPYRVETLELATSHNDRLDD